MRKDVDYSDDDDDSDNDEVVLHQMDDNGYDDVDCDCVFSITWPDTAWPPGDL